MPGPECSQMTNHYYSGLNYVLNWLINKSQVTFMIMKI